MLQDQNDTWWTIKRDSKHTLSHTCMCAMACANLFSFFRFLSAEEDFVTFLCFLFRHITFVTHHIILAEEEQKHS